MNTDEDSAESTEERMARLPYESTGAFACFRSWELDGFPGVTPRIADNQRLLLGFPGQKLIGIYIRHKAPHAMKSICQRESASAAAINQTRDQHAMVASDKNEAADNYSSFPCSSSGGGFALTLVFRVAVVYNDLRLSYSVKPV